MNLDQEYTIYFLQGAVTAYFLFQIPSGNNCVYSFTKLMILAVHRPGRRFVAFVKINYL